MWGSISVQGWTGFVLSRKLILHKSRINEWAKSNCGPNRDRKEVALRESEVLERLEERDLEKEELLCKWEYKASVRDCLRLEKLNGDRN